MPSPKFVPAKTRSKMTPGQMLRTMRRLQELSQAELARIADVPQPAISAIEGGRLELGIERARRFAKALHTHPAVLLFPDWEPERVERRTA